MPVNDKEQALLGRFRSPHDAPLVRHRDEALERVQGLGQIGILCAESAQPVERFQPGI